MKTSTIVALALLASCTKKNPDLCCTTDEDCASVGLASGTGCSDGLACIGHGCVVAECHGNADCPTDLPVCLNATCVACDETHACTITAPVCNLAVGSCGACTMNLDCAPFQNTICDVSSGICGMCTTHNQCDSKVCLQDGTCGTDASVAYVSPTGTDNPSCNQATPCKTVAAALLTEKPNIKLTGNLSDNVAISNQIVDIYADVGTRMSAADPSQGVFDIRNSTVSITDLIIANGVAGVSTLLDNGKVGLLTLDHVMVLDSSSFGLSFISPVVVTNSIFSGNLGGAVKSGQGSTTFVFQNNLIVGNGNASDSNDATGGINVLFSGPGPHDIEFNTFADNVAGPGFPKQTGLVCATLAQPPMTIENNIFSNNTANFNPGISECIGDYNLFDNGTAVVGTHDRTGLATFGNKNTSDPSNVDFYRTVAGSAAIDGGDPASKVTTDIDGVTRPQATGFDMGASEFKP